MAIPHRPKEIKLLDRLPLEILETVAWHLDRSDLISYSCTSRLCRIAAKANLFRRIELCGDHSRKKWESILRRNESLEFVRYLEVTASLAQQNVRTQDHWKADEDWDSFCHTARWTPPSAILTSNEDWLPLQRFIIALRGLRHLTWKHGCQVPPCIMEALHDRPIQLHINSFMLRGLVHKPQTLPIVDPYEKQIATAQCLSSLAMSSSCWDGTDELEYNIQALKEMIGGAAPNLRRVSLGRQDISRMRTQAERDMMLPWPKWQNGAIGRHEGSGALTHLDICYPVVYDPMKIVRELSLVTYFGKLQTLRLSVETADLRWFADNEHFRLRSLRALDTTIACRNKKMKKVKEFRAATNDFFSSLGRLAELRIAGTYIFCLQNIISHHGRSLTRLVLSSPSDQLPWDMNFCRAGIFTFKTLRSLQDSCPNLTELRIPFMRTAGDAEEVRAYRLIGSLPLKRLHLDIKFMGKRNEDLATKKDILVSYAIDKTLANAIYRIISDSGPKHGALEVFTLYTDWLDVRHRINLDSAYPPRLNEVLSITRHTCKSWKCERVIGDEDNPFCEEIDSITDPHFLANDRIYRPFIGDETMEAVHQVWPESISRDWSEVWHSSPLHGGTEMIK